MVIHFVFEASGGKSAVVAVLLKAGRPNATIEQLWKYKPKTPGKDHEILGVRVNPAGLRFCRPLP